MVLVYVSNIRQKAYPTSRTILTRIDLSKKFLNNSKEGVFLPIIKYDKKLLILTVCSILL